MGSLINLGGRKKGGGNGLAYLFGAIGVVLVLMFGLPAISDFAQDMGWTGGGGDGGATGDGTADSGGIPVVGASVWAHRNMNDLDPPDIDLYVYDKIYTSSTSLTSPASDGDVDWYIFGANPLTITPRDTNIYSNMDRFEHLINETAYITNGVTDFATNGQDFIDDDDLKAWIKAGKLPEGKLYILGWDEDYSEGNGGTTQPTQWPIIITIDLNKVDNGPTPGTQNAVEEVLQVEVGPNHTSPCVTVWPENAYGPFGWGYITVGAITVASTEDNSTEANTMQFTYTVTDNAGEAEWSDLELYAECHASSTSTVLNDIQVNEVSQPYKTETIAGTTYYYVKIPKDALKEGQNFTIDYVWDTDVNGSTLESDLYYGEFNGGASLYSSQTKVRKIVNDSASTKTAS